jgi:hypothetical protein
METTRRPRREEGILCGISSGTNVTAALRLAKELGPGRTVVTVLPDTGERYFSTPTSLNSGKARSNRSGAFAFPRDSAGAGLYLIQHGRAVALSVTRIFVKCPAALVQQRLAFSAGSRCCSLFDASETFSVQRNQFVIPVHGH